MTWQYPQPRTLTRVSIFPVPFKSASESGIDFGDDKEVMPEKEKEKEKER